MYYSKEEYCTRTPMHSDRSMQTVFAAPSVGNCFHRVYAKHV